MVASLTGIAPDPDSLLSEAVSGTYPESRGGSDSMVVLSFIALGFSMGVGSSMFLDAASEFKYT